MDYEQLMALAESYPPQERDSLLEVAQQYRSRSEREIPGVSRTSHGRIARQGHQSRA